MSKLISQLLQAKEPLFSLSLKQLEQVSGNKSVDVRLTAEIIEKKNDRIKRLGLDPNDTTGEELYKALLEQVRTHDEHLAKKIGGTDPEDVRKIIPLAVEAIHKTKMPRAVWVMKDEVAKRFLIETPPPMVMKRLGYDNIDTMLEKENIYEVYGALRFAESDEWLTEFNKKYERLQPTDFEDRDITLVVMQREKWSDVAAKFIKKKRHINTHLKELGVVLILPPTDDRMPAITLKVMALTYHYYNECRLYAAFFKLQQVKPDFGKIFVDTLNADPSTEAVVAGNNIHWRVIQRYYGKLKNKDHPEVFQPHVQPEDLHWRRAEQLMIQIDPELKFWEGLDYVADIFDAKPLTFNLMDVALSYANGISYKDRYIYHFQEALWNEVFMRYMGESVLEEQILRQLDNDLIEPENLSED